MGTATLKNNEKIQAIVNKELIGKFQVGQIVKLLAHDGAYIFIGYRLINDVWCASLKEICVVSCKVVDEDTTVRLNEVLRYNE
jgi:hypothetical protein